VKLIRLWKGVTHHVTVTDGGFVWQDRNCKSLSMIAREITGTPWSGPVFFGLKKSGTKQPPECPSPAVAAPAATRIPVRISAEEPAHG
jgi:hypothetical protein